MEKPRTAGLFLCRRLFQPAHIGMGRRADLAQPAGLLLVGGCVHGAHMLIGGQRVQHTVLALLAICGGDIG